MTSWTAVIALRLADYYIAASLLLLIVLALMLALRQPSRRLPVGWATILGLAALAVLFAVPGRPATVHLCTRTHRARVRPCAAKQIPAVPDFPPSACAGSATIRRFADWCARPNFRQPT